MQTIKVYKFEINADKRYLPKTTNRYICLLQERKGKDLTFTVHNFPTNEEVNSTTTQATLVEHNGQICESIRLLTPDGWHTFYANEWISRGKSVSELPKEEQEYIMAAVQRDVEFRKKHPKYNNASTITEVTQDGVRPIQ